MGRPLDGFLLPDGARVVGRCGDEYEMRITIPTDDDGFFGRQCPGCAQIFRIDSDDYEALPDTIELWCVYCGHHDHHSDFTTQQQLDRATRAVEDLGMQIIGKKLDRVFGQMSTPRPRSGFGIQINYRSKPFFPQPLPGIDEERLIRVRKCADCGVRYAVFGEHRYCPQCGLLSPKVIALDALAAEIARLDALALLPAEAALTLREQGVFNRIWVDTLENAVSIVETLASSAFRDAVSNAAQLTQSKGNIFQRLDHTADLFVTAGFRDLRTVLDTPVWQRLLQAWAKRHAFVHNDGIVDNKYLMKAPTSTVRLGQRLTITEAECRQVIDDTRLLCDAIAGLVGL